MGVPTNIEQQLSIFTWIVQQLAIRKVKACEICISIGHPINTYPTIQDPNGEQTNDVGDTMDKKWKDMTYSLTLTILVGRITPVLAIMETIKQLHLLIH